MEHPPTRQKTASTDLNAEPDTLVLTCTHIWTDGKRIIHVYHSSEDWQFLCEVEHYSLGEEFCTAVCFQHVADLDPTVRHVATIPVDHAASRDSIDQAWKIEPLEPESD